MILQSRDAFGPRSVSLRVSNRVVTKPMLLGGQPSLTSVSKASEVLNGLSPALLPVHNSFPFIHQNSHLFQLLETSQLFMDD